MALLVTGTAMLQCSFGAAPSVLTVLPKAQPLMLLPLAAIADSNPIVNVPPFAMCSSPANPTVAAALGAPMPCVPSTLSWMPGQPNVLIGGAPAVTSDCKLLCAYGGLIQIVFPGQTQAQT